MRRLLSFSIVVPLVLAAGSTRADSLSVAAWQQTVAARPEGNAENGERLYAQRGCPACHGAAGVPDNRAWPVLAGQRPLYLYKMLLDYRDGRIGGAEAALMAPVAGGLDRQQMADLAAWLGRRPRPPAAGHAAAPAVLRGDRARLIPPCEACHGANGQGWEVQPALAGQNRGYFATALARFKSGERNNDFNGGMAMIARKLTEEEIRVLADHYGR